MPELINWPEFDASRPPTLPFPRLPVSAKTQSRFERWLMAWLFPEWAKNKVQEILRNHGHLDAVSFSEAAMADLGVRYSIDHVARERVPAEGPLIVVANHPCGGIEALALLHWLGLVRRDVKVLANELLHSLPPLRDSIIPVDAFGGSHVRQVLHSSGEWLKQSGCLLIFPAGEVSRWRGLTVRESPWRRGFVRLAQSHSATVVPVRVKARNSVVFYLAGRVHSALATALLPRELLRPTSRSLHLDVGHARALTGDDSHAISAALQREVESDRVWREFGTALPANPRHERAWLKELLAGELLLRGQDQREVRLVRLVRGCALHRELARVREQSFRSVGEGCGKALDSDGFDFDYDQLVLFDRASLAIIGGYRLRAAPSSSSKPTSHGALQGVCDASASDTSNWYCSTLFRFHGPMQQHLTEAAELGRSFIDPRWFRTRALDELWRGIGSWLRRHPHVKYLFGAVSASQALPPAARLVLLQWCQQHYSRHGWAEGRHPVDLGHLSSGEARSLEASTAELRDCFAQHGVHVPPLFRHYVDLCEPGGVHFLAYSRDPSFSDCVDALVWLDLGKVRPHKRTRYLEDKSAATQHGGEEQRAGSNP